MTKELGRDANPHGERVYPPFDREALPVLRALLEELPSTLTAAMIPDLRAAESAEQFSNEDVTFEARYQVEEIAVPGPVGAPDVELLVSRPVNSPGPTPLIYVIHGGGMIAGTHRSTDALIQFRLAAEIGAAAISVNYRLAPEDPFPAQVEDCFAGLTWLIANAEMINIDPNRVVVAGGSAGGGLAACTALLARDRGGPRLAGQLLLSPMLDDRNDSASARQMDGLGMWDRGSNQLGWTSLLGEAAGGPDVSPYAAAARANDLSNLPPTFIDIGSSETFRDECVSYASRIWSAGGSAELHVWPGGFHGFYIYAPGSQLSQAALAQYLPWLRRTLGR